MKLYTEDEVRRVIKIAFWQDFENGTTEEDIIAKAHSIDLPTDDDICDEAESIAHNYFVMQRNHYQGLEEGAKRMAYWLINKLKQQDVIDDTLSKQQENETDKIS